MSKWKSSGAASYDPPFPPSNKKASESEIRGLFEALDKDGNGYIDRNELRVTMMEVGLSLSEKDINTMMQVANVPIKDRIFYEDFVRMMAGRIGHSQRRALFKKRDAQGPSTYTICEGEEEDNDIQAMRIAFSMFDRDGDGLISVQEVHDTMVSLGIKVTMKEVKDIVKKVDLDGDGSINFEEFCQAIGRRQTNVAEGNASNQAGNSKSKNGSKDAWGPSGHARTQELAEAFQVFDKDKDGYLNADDLKSTMQQLGLTLTESDLRAMMKSAKIGPGGKISFADFCHIYSNQYSTSMDSTTSALRKDENRKTFTNKLTKQQEIAEIRAVFFLFDMDKDGYITKDEVEEVLLSMGVHPSQECISQVFQQVDLDGNGKIDFDEFLLLVRKYERPLPEEVEAREMFKAMDRDGNGFIDTMELKASFGALGVPLTDDDVKIMMEEANIKSNKIFFKDFLRIMSGKFGASFSQNTSFDSDCSFDLGYPNFSSRDKTKSKTLTRQHAYVDRLMDNLEESEKEEEGATDLPVIESRTNVSDLPSNSDKTLMNAKEGQLQRVHESPLRPEVKRTTLLAASANATSLEVQDFFRESISSEFTPASLSNVYDLAPSSTASSQIALPRDIPVTQCLSSDSAVPQETTAVTSVTSCNSRSLPATTKPTSCKREQTRSTSQQRPGLVKGTPPSTWVAFKVFDRNADGYISKNELYRTMVELGINLSKEDLESMMAKADINKDGRIDYAEFSRLMMGSFEVYAKQAAQLSERRASSTICSSSSTFHVPHFAQQHHRSSVTTRHHHSSSPSSCHSNGAAVTVGKSFNPVSQAAIPTGDNRNVSVQPQPQRQATGTYQPREASKSPGLTSVSNQVSAKTNRSSPPQNLTQQRINESRTDHNRTIQPDKQALSPQRSRQASFTRSESTEEEMRTAFQIFDIDGNGLIDADELKQTMQNLDEVLTDKDVEAMILAVDKNGDGKVDYEEFLQLLRFTRAENFSVS